jgi:tetratricopeptide (TPR) repeat protein
MRLGGAVDLLRFRRKQNFVDLANHARDERQWELAARLYRKALDRNPGNVGIWVQYGHSLKESGELRDPDKLTRAGFAYRRALALDPGVADTHLQLGHVLKLQGKIEEAQLAYLRAFALDPAMLHPVRELSRLGWSEAQQAELRRLVVADGDTVGGSASAHSPQSASAGLAGAPSQAAGDLHRLRSRTAYSISSIDVQSFLAGYGASASVASGDALSEAKLEEQSATIILRNDAAGAAEVQVPPTEQAELLNALILAQRWDLDGAKEQLDDTLAENDRLKARITALEAELRDLRNACGAAGSPPASENSDPRHGSDADHPRLQMDEKPSRGEINSVDQDIRLLFDPDYYRSQAAARGLTIDDSLPHFEEIGGTLGLSPHPLFDAAYYLETNPDVKSAGANPLRHYLSHGDHENRNPHRLFNTAYYKSRAGVSENENALLHYIRIGGASTDPHPCFDTSYYLSMLKSPLPPQMSALEFYLTDISGMSVSPHPLFDQTYYASQLAEPDRRGPLLLHYLAQPPQEAASPHPLFDPDFFHESDGYSRPGLLGFIVNFRIMGANGYKLAEMRFREANQHFCSITYILDHPELLNGAQVPLVHYVRNAKHNVPSVRNRVHQAFDDGSTELYRPAKFAPSVLLEIASEEARRGARYLTSDDSIFQARTRTADMALRALFESTAPRVATLNDLRTVVGQVARSHRLAVYAIYVPDGELKAYHRAVLDALRNADYTTIVVNSTMMRADSLAEDALERAEAMVVRSGPGRDFASWIVALAHFAPVLEHVDHLLLLNDSLIGPFGDFRSVLDLLENDPADFKGLTESFEREYHLQSSLLMLSRDALFSQAFLKFFLNFAPPKTRDSVVREGEIGLSMQLKAAGITTASEVSYSSLVEKWLRDLGGQVDWAQALPDRLEELGLSQLLSPEVAERFSVYLEDWLFDRAAFLRTGLPCNPQHWLWDGLIRSGNFPFLKKDLLLINPEHIPTIVRLCDILTRDERLKFAEVLHDLAPLENHWPRSFLHLSKWLVDAIVAVK